MDLETADHETHAFVAEAETPQARRTRVREDVEAARTRWRSPAERPALFAVPVAVKDVIRVNGLPTLAGSTLPPATFAGPQATAVTRLLTAGAVVAGKTVTAEFAMSAPGPTRNPRNPAHTPGGSSSGSAAAVAAGTVPLAIGTQTVGSTIRPAAYCGVVGFKPTFGRVPTDGVIPNAPSLDTLGVFGTTVDAVAVAAAVLCDEWRQLPQDTAPLAPVVLGVPEGPYLEQAEPQALAAFARQLTALADAGITVRRVPMFADFADTAADMFVVNRYEAARTHTDWFARYGARYREQSAATVRQGQAVTREQYERGQRRRERFRSRLSAATAEAGVAGWVSPAATGPAPYGLDDTGNPVMCLPWSFAGWPALSVPAGAASNGLPLGLQCVAPAGADEELVAWGRLAARAVGRLVGGGGLRSW
jgi:Asp-tRNA(Asn)/Glu-tRNA(Gln) amidotransferase A subunit family amidase